MALSKIVADSIQSNAVVSALTDNTVTSAKLTTTGVIANSYGNSTVIPVVTIDASGRVTNASTSSIQTHLDTAYSNAVSVANTTSYNQAANAYANAVSTANTTSYNQAANAYANAITTANTTSFNQAANAYANVFNGGTFTGAVTLQANLTANTVRLNGNMQIDGDLIVTGNTVTMNVSSLSVEDNMIYLNASSNVANPDLGFAGNYNDGTYRHAGVFRDATDGVWKFFHQYVPEPDASAYIDTANNTFALANVQANTFIGSLSGSASSVGGNTASTLRSYSDSVAATSYTNATSYAASNTYVNDTFGKLSGAAFTGKVSINQLQITRSANNAALWLAESNLDTNHVMWNDYYGGPNTKGSGGSGFDGIKWNLYKGIHLRTGTDGQYNSLIISGTGGSTNDSQVFLYGGNDEKLKTVSDDGIQIQRDLYISGSTGGSYGNRLVVGATSTSYTTQDTNIRPTIQIHGQYPVLSLNHTVTTNANHGPTIQFTCNGTGNQFVIGTGGTGNMLSMGYSSTSDWNPHNGISGYSGTSFFQAGTNGYIGIGSNGDWTVSGGTGTNVPGYNLHFIGVHNGTNGHAALFRNAGSGNGGNGNGSGFIFVNTAGDHSWGIVQEIRIDGSAGTDRPSLLFSNGYDSNTWTVGFGYADSSYFRINRDHGHRNGSWGTTLFYMDRSGNVTISGAMNASAYYYTSDQRLKKNIINLNRNSDEVILRLRPVEFDWIESGSHDTGFIAQEVLEILPEAINKNKNDKTDEYTYTLNPTAIIAHLTKTVQGLLIKVEKLESKLVKL